MREHPLSNTILREMLVKYGNPIFLATIKALNILLKHSAHKHWASLQLMCGWGLFLSLVQITHPFSCSEILNYVLIQDPASASCCRATFFFGSREGSVLCAFTR